MREHNEAVNQLDVITGREEITVDYAPGSVELVVQHDGSVLQLRKLAQDYDVHDRGAAMAYLQHKKEQGEIATGLLFVDPEPQEMHGYLKTSPRPLNELREADLVPGAAALEKLNASLR